MLDGSGTPVPQPLWRGDNEGVELTSEPEPTPDVSPGDVVDWMRRLRVTQGPATGRPFEVLAWQEEFLCAALAPGVRQAGLSVARGNGKTTMVAALAAACIVGPLRQPRAEVPVVAASYNQARLAFEHVRAFVREMLVPAADWRMTDSLHYSLIEHKRSGARLRVISSSPKKAHGLAPSLIIADEPAQWERGDGERMYSALVTSMGKIAGARLIALGTRPARGDHWFSRLLDTPAPGMVARTYSAAPDAELDSEEAWRQANPSLAAMPELHAALRTEAEQAAKNPALVPAFRALRLNQGVDDSGAKQPLVDVDVWRQLQHGGAQPVGRMVLGVDLGGSQALSAAVAYWPLSGRLECLARIGAEPSLSARGARDGVGPLYEQAAAAGDLACDPGRVPDVGRLLEAAVARFGVPAVIVCDRWRLAELRDAVDGRVHPPTEGIVVRGQGFKDGAEDVRRFQDAVARGLVAPSRRFPLLEAGIADATVVYDAAGNGKLAKSGEGGRRHCARDDVAAAAILAVAHGHRVSGVDEAAARVATTNSSAGFAVAG